MQLSDFHYQLPDELIASHPLPERSSSRLLCLDKKTGVLQHKHFADILNFLNPGDLLVFNNTRVIPARLFGQKISGGKVEVLIERILENQRALAHIRASKSPKAGNILRLENSVEVEVLGRKDALFEIRFMSEKPIEEILSEVGHIPLPHYMARDEELSDRERYQTVYAKHQGAVAAPTAGLHFDEAMLKKIAEKGVETAFVTLHVGAGTFQPVRVNNITEHRMHAEWMEVSNDVCEKVNATKARGGRVIAVGTTSVRCLETAAQQGKIAPFTGETDIFIYPGYSFRSVDGLLTNFHLPESTLLMLVSAFAGYKEVMAAYQAAVAEKYRFFSYGDAMLLM